MRRRRKRRPTRLPLTPGALKRMKKNRMKRKCGGRVSLVHLGANEKKRELSDGAAHPKPKIQEEIPKSAPFVETTIKRRGSQPEVMIGAVEIAHRPLPIAAPWRVARMMAAARLKRRVKDARPCSEAEADGVRGKPLKPPMPHQGMDPETDLAMDQEMALEMDQGMVPGTDQEMDQEMVQRKREVGALEVHGTSSEVAKMMTNGGAGLEMIEAPETTEVPEMIAVQGMIAALEMTEDLEIFVGPQGMTADQEMIEVRETTEGLATSGDLEMSREAVHRERARYPAVATMDGVGDATTTDRVDRHATIPSANGAEPTVSCATNHLLAKNGVAAGTNRAAGVVVTMVAVGVAAAARLAEIKAANGVVAAATPLHAMDPEDREPIPPADPLLRLTMAGPSPKRSRMQMIFHHVARRNQVILAS